MRGKKTASTPNTSKSGSTGSRSESRKPAIADSNTKFGLISTVVTALAGLLGVVITAYLAYLQIVAPEQLRISATQTSEAKLLVPPATIPADLANIPVPSPTSLPAPISLLIASFDDCIGRTYLGGLTGVTFNSPDSINHNYVPEPTGGCSVKMEYHIEKNFVAFYLKLANASFAEYNSLSFDIRAEPGFGIPGEVKVDLKRSDLSESAFHAISGITNQWQTINIPFASMRPVPLSSLTDMIELVFTFERDHAGSNGIIYLDNILVTVR